MSSTQGHTNINTVHTTIDISVLLGEINRIADDSYSKGFESGYDVGVKKGKLDGARKFAEWLCGKYSRMKQDSIGFEMFQNIYWKSIDEVLAEWQKRIEE